MACTVTPPTVNHYVAAITHHLRIKPRCLALDYGQHWERTDPSSCQAEKSQEMGKVCRSAICGKERHRSEGCQITKKMAELSRAPEIAAPSWLHGQWSSSWTSCRTTMVYCRSSERSILWETKKWRGNFIRCPQLWHHHHRAECPPCLSKGWARNLRYKEDLNVDLLKLGLGP